MSIATTTRKLGGRFVIEREVGRGAVGIVYRAHDLQTLEPVALKVINSEAGVAPDEEARLMREGEVLARLDHPNIVRFVAVGVLDETSLPFVAMEWLDGEDLSTYHRHSPLGIAEAIGLMLRVGRALEAAHAAGVIHRDIKPSNIFSATIRTARHASSLDLIPKLVDFGVAARGDIRLTRSGDVVGTPAYMAPEQARGDAPIDARSDIYSLGATLFELIAGRPPHVGPTVIATLARLVTTPPAAAERAPPRRAADRRRDRAPHARDRSQSASGFDGGSDRDARATPLRGLARASWADVEPARSSRLGSSASRLVTSIVAIRFESGSARERALESAAPARRRRGAARPGLNRRPPRGAPRGRQRSG